MFPGLDCLDNPFYDDGEIAELISYGSTLDLGQTDTSMEVSKCPVKDIDAEVGDDLIAVANNKEYLEKRVHVLESYMDLKVSRKDTSINRGMGNFAEGLVLVPRKYEQSWLHAKSTSTRGKQFGYIDVPKIRLILPVRSQRLTWSSTDVGKFTDFGNLVRWTPTTSPYYGTMTLGSLMQDTILGATGKSTCVYLPLDFSGAGKPIPFGSSRNFINFVHTWRTGRYHDTTTAMMRQLNRLMAATQMGELGKYPQLLMHFTKWDPIFTDWVKDEKSILLSSTEIPEEFSEYSAATYFLGDKMAEPCNRLVASNRLVTESKLAIAIRHNELTSALVSKSDFSSCLEKLRENHRQNVEATRVTGKILQKEEFRQEIAEYMLEGQLRESDVRRFFSHADNVRNIRKLINIQEVYWPAALDAVYRKGPMVLKGLYCNPNILGTKKPMQTAWVAQADFGNTEEAESLDQLEHWLRMGGKNEPPRALIDDDGSILRQVEKERHLLNIVITDDRALCRSIVRATRAFVLRLPVEFYYRLTYFGDGLGPTIDSIKAEFRFLREPGIYEDTGSIQSGEEKLFRDGMMYPSGVETTQLDHGQGWSQRPKASPGKELDFEAVLEPPRGFPLDYLYDTNKFGR